MLILSLILACTPKQPEPVVSTNPAQRKAVFELPKTVMINKDLRQSWPPSSWKTAKAYAFNQQEFGPGVLKRCVEFLYTVFEKYVFDE